MTTIVIAAFGSRGDVAPTGPTWRASSIQEGYRVAVAAQEPYRELVSACGIEFRSLPGDTERATKASPAAQAFVDGARMRPSRELLDEMREDLRQLGRGLIEAAKDADLLLLPSVAALLGYHVAEGLGIPSVGVLLQPTAPPATSCRRCSAPGRSAVGATGSSAGWAGSARKRTLTLINELRTELRLPRTTLAGYQRRRAYLADPARIQRARGAAARGLAGSTCRSRAIGGRRSPTTGRRLRNWSTICRPVPPVFVGLGSTATARGPELSNVISSALRATGTRAVVQSGWAGLHCTGDDVLMVDELPHSWLFPQVAARRAPLRR